MVVAYHYPTICYQIIKNYKEADKPLTHVEDDVKKDHALAGLVFTLYFYTQESFKSNKQIPHSISCQRKQLS